MKILTNIKFYFFHLIGIEYVINLKTKTIHRISHIQENCHLEQMENKIFVKYDDEYLLDRYRCCSWCYDEDDD